MDPVVKFLDKRPIHLVGLKINKYKTVGDLKAFLITKIPKFGWGAEEVTNAATILFGDVYYEDS